jgi:hypothetical protein
MNKLFLLCGALSLSAASAFAQTIDPNALNGLTHFSADGVGTTPACGSSDQTPCTSAGTAKGEPFGIASYSTLINVNTNDTFNPTNGSDGRCRPRASGTITLTTPSGDTISLRTAASHCDAFFVAATDGAFPWVLDSGSYTISGGTGRYSTAVGTGTFSVAYSPITSITALGPFPAYLHINGNIKLH